MINIGRYLVFAGYWHYPDGGWGDFQKDFSDLEEAKALVKKILAEGRGCGGDGPEWAHIIDLHTKEEIECDHV